MDNNRRALILTSGIEAGVFAVENFQCTLRVVHLLPVAAQHNPGALQPCALELQALDFRAVLFIEKQPLVRGYVVAVAAVVIPILRPCSDDPAWDDIWSDLGISSRRRVCINRRTME